MIYTGLKRIHNTQFLNYVETINRNEVKCDCSTPLKTSVHISSFILGHSHPSSL